MSSVSQPIKGKENLVSRNIQARSKNRGRTTLRARPGARTFGTELFSGSNGQELKGKLSEGHNGKRKTTKRKTKTEMPNPGEDVPPCKIGRKARKETILINAPKIESGTKESRSVIKDEEKLEVFGDDVYDSQDEANQITEYADETDLWGSEDEGNRVNDYGLN